MKRSHIIWIAASAAIITITLLLIFATGGKKLQKSEALKAIPIDAALVIKTNNFGGLLNTLYQSNEFWEGIGSLNAVADANHFFELAQRLKEESSTFSALLFGNPVLMSAHPVGKGTAELFFTANLPEKLKPSDIKSVLDKQFQDYKLTGKEYNDATIHTYGKSSETAEEAYSFAVHKGVVMYSRSQLLVEAALGQLDSGISLEDNAHFMGAYKTAGTRVNANLFVNYTRLPNTFVEYIHTNQKAEALNLAKIGRWSELDLSIRNDEIFLNGFAQVPDSVNSYLRMISHQKPVELEIHNVLPSQTAAILSLGISNWNTYFKSFKQILQSNGRIRAYENNLKKFDQELNVNIEQFYQTIFDQELSLAFIPFDSDDNPDSWFVVTKVKSISQAEDEFKKLINSYCSKNNLSPAQFEETFTIDREKSAKIYRFPKPGMHKALFGDMFAWANDSYFTFIDSYVIFGPSSQALSKLILAKIHNKQLALEPAYREFSQGLTSESNFQLYIKPGKSELLFKQFFTPKAAEQIISKSDALSKIQGMAFQLSGGKGMVYHNVYARYSPHTYETPQTVWETRLDTGICMKPQIVINHNTQAREIFVQDFTHNIYLINEVGRVLWKRPLGEKIEGEVHQIDIYKNGKLQLLFNTRSWLYLVDRNGNNVEGFPVKLRSPATNAVAIFDYDNNRNYRFFIAGEDQRIYAYDSKGNIVPGWNFDKSEKPVTQPIRHFRIDTRDYIVFSDENRIYILDRKGDTRVKVSDYFTIPNTASITLEKGAKPRFVTVDVLGDVKYIYLDGKVESKSIQKVSNSFTFDYQDVNGDGKNDFIYLDQNKLSVYHQNGKLLFSQKFKEEFEPVIIYFHFGARDRKLGLISTESSQIYLVNGDGTPYNGFPLKGATPFSIARFAGSKSAFNLIVGSSTGYVLNYAVQ